MSDLDSYDWAEEATRIALDRAVKLPFVGTPDTLFDEFRKELAEEVRRAYRVGLHQGVLIVARDLFRAGRNRSPGAEACAARCGLMASAIRRLFGCIGRGPRPRQPRYWEDLQP